MNNGIHVSLSVFISSGYMSKSGIAGSCGGFITSFLRNLDIFFYSGYINLHSHQQCKSVPFSPHPLQHLVCRLFDDGHSVREVISLCSFDVHFSNNKRCWTSFHVFVSHLYVWLFEALWTLTHQALLFMGFFRQEYWSGYPFPSPGDLQDQGLSSGLPRCRQILKHPSHQRKPKPIFFIFMPRHMCSWDTCFLIAYLL